MFNGYKRFFKFASKYISNWRKGIAYEVIRCIFEGLQFLALLIVLKTIIEGGSNIETGFVALGIMLVSVIGASVMWNLAHKQEALGSYLTCRDKRINIGKRMKYMPLGFFNNYSLGNITAVVTTTMEDMEAMAFAVIVRTLIGVIHATVFSLCAFILEWRVGIIFIIGLVGFLLVNGRLLNKSKEVSPQRLMAQSELVDAVLEYIQGMGIVKSFHLIDQANTTINNVIDKTEQQNLKVEKLRIPYIAIERCILSLASVAACLISIHLYLSEAMPLFTCLLMMIASFMVYAHLEVAGKMFFMLPMIDASIERVEEVENAPVMNSDGIQEKPKNYDIAFNNVSFSYGERTVIDNISFTIEEGKTTAIVGPSGGGKTTLCNLIPRFWDVNEGSILMGNRNIREYDHDELLSNISMVFQKVYLFNDTIENNIKFGKPNATFEEVVNAAKKACCHGFIMELPDGYNTIIGEGGGTISGGEKQRISIARAILKDSPIIILDEATANVDPENENKLQDAIYELTKEKTVIMIAHRLKTVKHAEQIIVLSEGKIVQKGVHNQLMSQKGLYRDFVNQRKKAVGWKIRETVIN